MELGFSAQDRAFRAEVRRFIDRHWPASVRAGSTGRLGAQQRRGAAERAWLDALASRGWSVPDWPVAHGGPGWTPTQRFIWNQEAARAEVPRRNDCGPAVVGPLLCRWGRSAQQARLLPPIREGRMRWCRYPAEWAIDGTVAHGAASAVRHADHYLVNADDARVHDAGAADWMLCLVGAGSAGGATAGFSLLLIDMSSPGVVLAGRATAAGVSSVERVTLRNVRVPLENLLGRENAGSTYLAGLPDLHGGAAVATSRVQFERLGRLAAEMPAQAGSVADDEAFQSAYHGLGIDLLGLEMLELRVLADITGGGRARPGTSALRALIDLKRAAVDQRIGELMMEALGYYALPCPDELLIDNEGPVGNDHALRAQRYWLAAHREGPSEHHKDIIAGLTLDP